MARRGSLRDSSKRLAHKLHAAHNRTLARDKLGRLLPQPQASNQSQATPKTQPNWTPCSGLNPRLEAIHPRVGPWWKGGRRYRRTFTGRRIRPHCNSANPKRALRGHGREKHILLVNKHLGVAT